MEALGGRVAGGDRAVVMGAGVAGLLAARVLADHFGEVIVLDRDVLPDEPMCRRGIPQGRHLHTLLPGGFDIASGYFPGFGDDLLGAGAVRTRFGQDLCVIRPEGRSYLAAVYRSEPLATGIGSYSMSRGLLEHVVRRRLSELPGVTVLGGRAVRAPVVDDGAVTGVELQDGTRVAAGLVVDTSGRAARSLGWLPALGCDPPEESAIQCDFAYASAVVRPRDPGALEGSGVMVVPDPTSATPTRAGYLVPIEDGLWMAGLGGRFGDYPPTPEPAWRAFGATLASPMWHDLVATATVVDGPHAFRFPRSVRRHVERMPRFPRGLVLLGDALCQVNPVYGHGMSSAALQARALDDALTERASSGGSLDDVAGAFAPRAFEATRAPWAIAAGSDILTPGTRGDFPEDDLDRLLRFARLGTTIDDDPAAAALFVDIFTLRQPLTALDEAPWPALLAATAAGV